MVSRLVQLTSLEVRNMGVSGPALRGLSLLSGLEHLVLIPQGSSAAMHVPHAALSHISGLAQLTALHLSRPAVSISSSTTPGFSTLTALQRLAVQEGLLMGGCHGGLHPEVLAGMTGLQELDLAGSPVQGGSAGVAALLQLLALRT
jgi:hypothetical protein